LNRPVRRGRGGGEYRYVRFPDEEHNSDADPFRTSVSALGYVTFARQKSRKLVPEFLMNTYKLILNR
jgi:hypothetical protein